MALLEDEGGGGDVGEHDAHGEGLNEGVAQELAVARDGKVRLEGGEEAWTAFARGGASGLAEAEEHEEEEDAEGEKDGEYAPPVGERQEEAAEDGSEDGGEALHDAEHGEVAGKAVALVEVDGDGAGDDDSARPGDALEEAVGEEEADVGGEKARSGGDEKEEEGGHEGRFAAEAVAERADEELPETESHHAEGEAELDGGDGGRGGGAPLRLRGRRPRPLGGGGSSAAIPLRRTGKPVPAVLARPDGRGRSPLGLGPNGWPDGPHRRNAPGGVPGTRFRRIRKNSALPYGRALFNASIRLPYAFLAISVSWVKAAASLTAISASIFRLISMPATFRPCMKVE